jgi:hypothetical protein
MTYAKAHESYSFDAIVKSIIVSACLSLHADAARLRIELLASSRCNGMFFTSNVSKNTLRAAANKLGGQTWKSIIPNTMQCSRRLKQLADLALLAGSPLDVGARAREVARDIDGSIGSQTFEARKSRTQCIKRHALVLGSFGYLVCCRISMPRGRVKYQSSFDEYTPCKRAPRNLPS